MKTCLNCQKEFEAKREAARYCSDKCRVMYNRKNPKNAITPVQMQALYNTMMEKLGKIELAPPQTAYNASKFPATFKEDEPLSFEKLKQEQTFKQPLPRVAIEAIKRKYVEDRRDITCDEEYMAWIERLESDNRLTNKDKDLVKNTH